VTKQDKIPNDKSQVPNKFQIQMTKTVFFSFGIWVIEIYLLLGACKLVLLRRSQHCFHFAGNLNE